MTGTTAIFWPMIAHFVLVGIVYYLLSAGRVRAVKEGKATVSQFRENRDEPEYSLFARNNLENQFELPVFFNIVCLSLFVTGHATLYPVLLAWLFVISRYAHSYIHIKTNRIRHRRPLFIAGFLILLLMWLWFAIKLATG
jgi:hypothetical protein